MMRYSILPVTQSELWCSFWFIRKWSPYIMPMCCTQKKYSAMSNWQQIIPQARNLRVLMHASVRFSCSPLHFALCPATINPLLTQQTLWLQLDSCKADFVLCFGTVQKEYRKYSFEIRVSFYVLWLSIFWMGFCNLKCIS